MSKPKLNSEAIRSELSESAYFRRPQPKQAEAEPMAQPRSQEHETPVLEPASNVQTFKRTDVQTNVRSVIRASFDIYQDQQQALSAIQAARFKQTGRKPKMGELAQEAFDLYIRTVNEQTNG